MNPIYFQIHKVDEERREVSGRATDETLDRDGEVMDYVSSKPNFQAWSAEVFKDSGGLSHGNLRAMHGNVCAGKLTDIEFRDSERAIDITAKILDDNEWQKVLEGAYLGFSIGGRYARKWTDVSTGKAVTKFTAVPNEISIVDRPSCPTAKFFSIHKRSGAIVQKAFQSSKSNIEFKNGRVQLGEHVSRDAIRKIHATGRQRMTGDFLWKFEQPGTDDRQRQATTLMQKRVRVGADGSALRKVTMPPQSSNATSGGAIANTGASNNWHDQEFDRPNAARVGGHVIGKPSDSNRDAAVDALKRDLSRPKRMGV